MITDKVKKAIVNYLISDGTCVNTIANAVKAKITNHNYKVGNNDATDIMGYVANFVFTHDIPLIVFAYDQIDYTQGYDYKSKRNIFIESVIAGLIANRIIDNTRIDKIAINPIVSAIDGYSNRDILVLVDTEATASKIAKIYGTNNYKYIAINDCSCNYKTVSFWGSMGD